MIENTTNVEDVTRDLTNAKSHMVVLRTVKLRARELHLGNDRRTNAEQVTDVVE